MDAVTAEKLDKVVRRYLLGVFLFGLLIFGYFLLDDSIGYRCRVAGVDTFFTDARCDIVFWIGIAGLALLLFAFCVACMRVNKEQG